ncbi:MAG: hypothetical protein JOZ81_10220 [Chloroflexi bacterium]|nr:hypothetical protein [Chloroflexota bacterium]
MVRLGHDFDDYSTQIGTSEKLQRDCSQAPDSNAEIMAEFLNTERDRPEAGLLSSAVEPGDACVARRCAGVSSRGL